MLTRTSPTVELIDSMGSDTRICAAAKVLKPAAYREFVESGKPPEGLIKYLMAHRHGSPFEHTAMTFYVECSIAICREFERHRIGFSFQDEISLNVESGRYSELADEFQAIATDRPVRKAPDFKVSRPEMYPDAVFADKINNKLTSAYSASWGAYQELLSDDVPREVARLCLPVGIFTRLWVTCNARAMCHFLSLRVRDDSALIKSFPQWEIQQVAHKMEEHFAGMFPLTHRAFLECGRVGP